MKIRDMRKALDSKEISAKELAQTYFERIKKYDDKVKSFITVTEEKALEQAEKAQGVIDKGEAKALTGIPVAVKDNICTEGVKTTCASKMLENFVPPYNATVMEKLDAENIVMLGKTSMDEFAMGSSCETSYFGGAMNPFDSNYVSGGSSGGVASAVGANIAAYGLGSDTGGMKIGIAKEYLEGVRDDVKEAVLKAADIYKSMGAEIVYFDLPELKFALPVYYIIACAEASSNLGRYDGIRFGYKTEHYNGTHDMVCRTRSEGFGEEVKRRILLGTYVLSAGYYDAYYKKAQNLRGTIVKAFNNAFEKCDVILAPTVPMTAFEKGHAVSDPIETYLTDICTVPVNIAGLPGVSVPCGFNAKGMPIGMQLIGKSFGEAEILNAAYKYQQAAAENFKDTKWGVKL